MKEIHAVSQRIVWLVAYFSMRLFANFSVVGKEKIVNLPRPLLIIANHRTYWDAMIIGTLFPFFSTKYLPIGFMADDMYFRNVFFRWFLKLNGVSPNWKKTGLDISLKYPREVLGKRRGVFLLFPWGRRIYNAGDHGLPARGAAILAREIPELTILPIFLDTSSGVTPLDFFQGKKKITVAVGELFKLTIAERIKGDQEISEKLGEIILRTGRLLAGKSDDKTK